MSPETADAAAVPEHLVCDAGCSPSHRRTRRFLTSIALTLAFAIVCLVGYCLWSNAA